MITAVRDESGELVGFAKVTRDLTERRAAEVQAVRLAAELAAREAAEARSEELDALNHQLQDQAVELEVQAQQAQELAQEIELTAERLEDTLVEAEAARSAAESSERFARGILESIADPFVVQDVDWRFRYINARAAETLGESGHGPEELIGRVVWEVYPQLAGTKTEILMRRAASERIPIAFEARTADGRRWSSLYRYPLPDGGLATQWRDITERKRAEEPRSISRVPATS